MGVPEGVLGLKSSLTFHWQELGHMTTPNAKEPGKCGPYLDYNGITLEEGEGILYHKLEVGEYKKSSKL